MKRIIFILMTVFFVVYPPLNLFAGEPSEKGDWKTHVELSYVNTGGNTDTQTYASKLKLKKEGLNNRYFFDGYLYFAESNGEETSNKVSSEGRWERVFRERLFEILMAGFIIDKFSGYDYRIYGGPGVGYDFIKTTKQRLQSIISLIYFYDEFSVANKGTDEYIAGKATIKYDTNIRENLLVKEVLDYFVSFNDTERAFLDSETSLDVKINHALSLGVSYIINYQNLLPSPDIKHTDTTLMTKFIIDF